MNPWLAAAILGGLGVLAAFSVVRDLRSGTARSFVREYHVDENPVSYALCIGGDLLAVVLGAATILYALGIIGNPLNAINGLFSG